MKRYTLNKKFITNKVIDIKRIYFIHPLTGIRVRVVRTLEGNVMITDKGVIYNL